MDKQQPDNIDPEVLLATLDHVSKTLDMLSGVVHRLQHSMKTYISSDHSTQQEKTGNNATNVH